MAMASIDDLTDEEFIELYCTRCVRGHPIKDLIPQCCSIFESRKEEHFFTCRELVKNGAWNKSYKRQSVLGWR